MIPHLGASSLDELRMQPKASHRSHSGRVGSSELGKNAENSEVSDTSHLKIGSLADIQRREVSARKPADAALSSDDEFGMDPGDEAALAVIDLDTLSPPAAAPHSVLAQEPLFLPTPSPAPANVPQARSLADHDPQHKPSKAALARAAFAQLHGSAVRAESEEEGSGWIEERSSHSSSKVAQRAASSGSVPKKRADRRAVRVTAHENNADGATSDEDDYIDNLRKKQRMRGEPKIPDEGGEGGTDAKRGRGRGKSVPAERAAEGKLWESGKRAFAAGRASAKAGIKPADRTEIARVADAGKKGTLRQEGSARPGKRKVVTEPESDGDGSSDGGRMLSEPKTQTPKRKRTIPHDKPVSKSPPRDTTIAAKGQNNSAPTPKRSGADPAPAPVLVFRTSSSTDSEGGDDLNAHVGDSARVEMAHPSSPLRSVHVPSPARDNVSANTADIDRSVVAAATGDARKASEVVTSTKASVSRSLSPSRDTSNDAQIPVVGGSSEVATPGRKDVHEVDDTGSASPSDVPTIPEAAQPVDTSVESGRQVVAPREVAATEGNTSVGQPPTQPPTRRATPTTTATPAEQSAVSAQPATNPPRKTWAVAYVGRPGWSDHSLPRLVPALPAIMDVLHDETVFIDDCLEIRSDTEFAKWLSSLLDAIWEQRPLSDACFTPLDRIKSIKLSTFPSPATCAVLDEIRKCRDTTSPLFTAVSKMHFSLAARNSFLRRIVTLRPEMLKAYAKNFARLAVPSQICLELGIDSSTAVAFFDAFIGKARGVRCVEVHASQGGPSYLVPHAIHRVGIRVETLAAAFHDYVTVPDTLQEPGVDRRNRFRFMSDKELQMAGKKEWHIVEETADDVLDFDEEREQHDTSISGPDELWRELEVIRAKTKEQRRSDVVKAQCNGNAVADWLGAVEKQVAALLNDKHPAAFEFVLPRGTAGVQVEDRTERSTGEEEGVAVGKKKSFLGELHKQIEEKPAWIDQKIVKFTKRTSVMRCGTCGWAE